MCTATAGMRLVRVTLVRVWFGVIKKAACNRTHKHLNSDLVALVFSAARNVKLPSMWLRRYSWMLSDSNILVIKKLDISTAQCVCCTGRQILRKEQPRNMELAGKGLGTKRLITFRNKSRGCQCQIFQVRPTQC